MASPGPERATAEAPDLASPLPPGPPQGSAPAGCGAEPPDPGCAAGGPPPEGLGRPGFRHRGGAAAARWVLLRLAPPAQTWPCRVQVHRAGRNVAPPLGHRAAEEKGRAKWKPPKLGGPSWAVYRPTAVLLKREPVKWKEWEEPSRTAPEHGFIPKGAFPESKSPTDECKRPYLENAGLAWK